MASLKTMVSKEYPEKRNYIAQRFREARKYEEDVLSGEQISSNWIKKAVLREKNMRKKYDFRYQEVAKVYAFIYYVYITVDGHPQRFTPSPWQSWIIFCIFGLYRSAISMKRLRRFVIIWVARKSGKTTLAAILALYSFLKEERNAEVYFAATTKDQASQALRYLKQMVTDSPALRKRVDKLQYMLRHNLNGLCYAKPLANEPDKLDGLSPNFAVLDECHALPDKEMFNIIKTGTLARKNPLIVQISTAGHNRDYPFFQDLEIGKRVLNEELTDDSTFYAYYTLDDDEEVEDPNTWEKANPGLNQIIQLEDLLVDWDKAKLTVTDRLEFITKNLNIYTDGEDTWIPDEEYRKCFEDVDIESLKGCKAYLGIDLSTSRDLSSVVCVVEHPVTKKLQVIPEFYFPGDAGQDKRIRITGIDLTSWIDKGFILEHEGKIIDYDRVFERIQWFCDYFDVQAIGYDPWNATLLIDKIEKEIYVDLQACKQNTGFFNFPLKFIERLIFSRNIVLSKNPVLRWNFRNVVIYLDGNNNIKIVKNKSLDSVDGAVALGIAVGMYCKYNYDAIAAVMEGYINNET